MCPENRKEKRASRHRRVRRKVAGTVERPRMSIMISCKHSYVQFVDDDKGMTLASVSTLGGDNKNNVAAAKSLGVRAAQVALKAGINSVVIDRGGFKFHGRVKAIVEAASGAGIKVGVKKES